MKYALISGNRVLQVSDAAEDGGVPFQVNEAFQWVECGDQIDEWYTYENEAFTPLHPSPDTPAEPADLLAYAADLRWQREVGGVTVAAVPVSTDDRSKVMIVGARVAAAADPEWSTIWHGADGNTYQIDAPAMLAISDAVQAHVNGTFATFATVKAQIEAGAVTTRSEIDTLFAG